MQHQALKYSPSLINDGQFTQGLSHWFGSYVKHGQTTGYNVGQAECDAKPASDYAPGMPFGISQYVDAPEVHSFPSTRTASNLRMLPLGTKLALLVSNVDTKLDGALLTPGIVGAASPADRFQHPFRWQDNSGAINIKPTSELSIDGYAPYAQDYTAGSLLVLPTDTEQEIAQHRLYVAPKQPLVPDMSSEGFGGVRVECVPDGSLRSGVLTFIGDSTELAALRTQLTQTGVAQMVAVMGDRLQVSLRATLGGITPSGPRRSKFSAQYDIIYPGGLAPVEVEAFVDWALFRTADISCAYIMPLYGYKYTLGYSYTGRKPQPAGITFRAATAGADGFTLDGFGAISFNAYSDRTARIQRGAKNNALRNLEVIRGESRTKVVGRPMLTIPVVDVTDLEDSPRSLTRVKRLGQFSGGSAGIEFYVDPSEIDLDARPVRNLRWENGTGVSPGRLYLGGIVENGNIGNTPPGGSLGPVTFTGHLENRNGALGQPFIGDSRDLVAAIAFDQPIEFTANLFRSAVNQGEELYVEFTDKATGTPIIDWEVTFPDRALTGSTVFNPGSYVVAGFETLAVRGEHFGTDLRPQYARARVGSTLSINQAPTTLVQLDSTLLTVQGVNYLRVPEGTILIYEVDPVPPETVPYETDVAIDPALGTRIGPISVDEQPRTAYISDVSMWVGDQTNSLNLADSPDTSERSLDLLERHTDPLSSLFPRGMVMLYAGGGSCPAGFKPVQAKAESREPGVPSVEILPELVSATYDSRQDKTRLVFASGQLPYLRDVSGVPVSAAATSLTAFPAPSLEYNPDGPGRAPALDGAGSQVSIATTVDQFRYAVEPGMVIRVEESDREDSAPLVNEDRGFLVTGGETEVVQPNTPQASAKRPTYINGQNGYEGRSYSRDVSVVRKGGPEEHYGCGFGTVRYPSVDIGMQTAYDPDGEGFNVASDQQLTNEFNTLLGMEEDSFLLPKYPTRFAQNTNLAPIGPNTWGQRERFYYETAEQVDPTQGYSRSPEITNRQSPAMILTFHSANVSVQLDIGNSTSNARAGINAIGPFGFLPNPAWDLSNPGAIDTTAFPPQPVSSVNDLIFTGGATGSITAASGMVFFCRIYARCDAIVDGRPTGTIRGYMVPTSERNSHEANEGVPFLWGTLFLESYQVATDSNYDININFRVYNCTNTNVVDGLRPQTQSGSSWPGYLPRGAIFQCTPAVLYGQPNQPQEYGVVNYTRTNGTRGTYTGRYVPEPHRQDTFSYTRSGNGASAVVTAWYSVAPTNSADTVSVAGDLSGAAEAKPRMFIEPSGYLKYGQTGAAVDYGPGKHSHEIARNPNLLSPMNLAQPDLSETYRLALPSVHGHGSAGEPRAALPAANLFTSCIKL